jgi:Flp pilus assembly protein TadD
MSCASGTGSRNRHSVRMPASGILRWTLRILGTSGWVALALIALALLGACSSSKKGETPGKTVLATKQGESSIQVTESEIDGNQVVRINTKYRGEDHSIVLQIDQDVYDVEIPLTLEQIAPQSTSAAAKGPEGQFQDMLIAQYFEKAQEAMLAGDYAGALRQVNLVLLTRPDHVQAHSMKGSIYYAMGNYQLAEEEWQRTLQLEPGNAEVRQFMDFLKNRKGAPQPPLPAAPGAAPGAGAPKPPGGSNAAAPATPQRRGSP